MEATKEGYMKVIGTVEALMEDLAGLVLSHRLPKSHWQQAAGVTLVKQRSYHYLGTKS